MLFSKNSGVSQNQGSAANPTQAAGGLYNPGSNTDSGSPGSGVNSQSTPSSSSKVKFETSTYKPLSQQVYPGPLSTQSSITKDGSTITAVHQPDGSTTVTLHINRPGYQDVVVKAVRGETVYYTSLTYPTPPQGDYGDTGLILVDSGGFIVPSQ